MLRKNRAYLITDRITARARSHLKETIFPWFRTLRHIIRMMVKMIDPKPGERIGDLLAGMGGFLVNAYQHVIETHTSAGTGI